MVIKFYFYKKRHYKLLALFCYIKNLNQNNMNKKRKTINEEDLNQIPRAALFAALSVILPQFFHLVGLGAIFLPMFLPVMLGSMLLKRRFAFSVAFISPLISWILTGMPPLAPPVLPVITLELTAVSLTISTLRVHHHKTVMLSLTAGILVDRLLLFIVVILISPLFGIDNSFFSLALVMSGIPGIILQLIAIPLAMRLIQQKFPQYR